MKKLPVRVGSTAIAIVVMVGVALPDPDLRAQETPLSIEQLGGLSLEELLDLKITTASLRPQELRDVPATAYVVTEADIRVYGYRDLKDILRNLPGIEYVYPNSHLFGGQRGFSSFWENTKLLIDGREANMLSADAAYIVNQFSLTGVKQVEIVQGPASVLYGPEAFTGVINIITKDGENSPEEQELTALAGGGDKSSYDINGAFHTVAKRGPFGLAVGGYMDGGSGPDFTDFVKTGYYTEANRGIRTFLLDNGNQYRDNDRNIKFNGDLKYSPIGRIHLKAGALHWRIEDGGGIENPELSYTNFQDIREQTHFYVSGEYRFATVPVKSTLQYHHIAENSWVRFQNRADLGDNPPLLTVFNIEDSKLNAANLQIDYFPSIIDNYFLAGIGVRNTRIGEPAFTGVSTADTNAGQPDPLVGRYLYPPTGYFPNLRPYLEQDRFYVYAQDQQSIWNKKIQITAGLRYDHNSIYGSVWNVRSGLLLQPLANYTLRGIFGQGFREPTIFELSDNPNLNPTRMNTWEVSLLFAPVRNLSGQVAYFQNRASDLIALSRGTTGRGGTPENIGEKRVAGFETLLKYQVGPLAGDLSHSYEYSIDDQPLIGTADNKLGFGGHYGYGEHLSLGLRAKYTSRAEGLALDAQGNPLRISVPEYFTLDANALARELRYAGVRWEVSFSILNILDRQNHYVNTVGPNPSRFLAEGREYFGKAAVRF
jgi:outer membrane receptor for ferrienterochelin and colicins